jgi:hypothetical protein
MSAATVSGSKTVTKSPSPGNTAAALTIIFATAGENWTVANLAQIQDAIKRVPGGGVPTALLGSLIL